MEKLRLAKNNSLDSNYTSLNVSELNFFIGKMKITPTS